MTRELLRTSFEVAAPIQTAWDHLSRVEQWTSWAFHIKRVELGPPGALTAESVGRFHLSNGVKSSFVMRIFEPPHRWLWSGPFLWMQVHYDHLFEALPDGRTRLTWIIEGEGFGISLFGRLFASIYRRNLEKAVPRLQSEFSTLAAPAP